MIRKNLQRLLVIKAILISLISVNCISTASTSNSRVDDLLYSQKISLYTGNRYESDKSTFLILTIRDYDYVLCPEDSIGELVLNDKIYTLKISDMKMSEGYSRVEYIDGKTVYTYPNECITYFLLSDSLISSMEKAKSFSFRIQLYDFVYQNIKPVTITIME